MLGMEPATQLLERRHRHGQGDLAVAGPQLEQLGEAYGLRCAAVGRQLGARLLCKATERLMCLGKARWAQLAPQTGAAHRQAVGYTDAERREHARQRMHQNSPYSRGT